MGVWSSISFCNVDKRRIRRPASRNFHAKQILNIDCDSFSSGVLQDLKEIRIQEFYFDNPDEFPRKTRQDESINYPTYFEYSMGGNLKFYKEHLQQDFTWENKLCPVENSRQRLRKTSHSDNDSEPESLRYARKPPEKVVHVVNTIAEEQEPELSFDDYSTIYQPEFMLNINSKSLVKEMPKHLLLGDNVIKTDTTNEKRKDTNILPSWSQDLAESPSLEKIDDEVRVVTKPEILSKVKQNIVFPKKKEVFDYQSSSVKTSKNDKQEDDHKAKSKEQKNPEYQSSKTNMTPQKIKANRGNSGNLLTTKTPLPKEKSKLKKHNRDDFNHSASPQRKAENKNKPKNTPRKKAEKKEKTKELITSKKEFDNEKPASKSFENKDILPSVVNTERKTDKTQENLNSLSRLSIADIDLFGELGLVETENKFSEPKTKDVEFYPESPISELHFFKTPCSTRHNSLETFEQLENECHTEESKKQEPEKLQDSTLTSKLIPAENYKKLPKEFQEMARRLSKKESPKKSSPSFNQAYSSQNFNCSSSTCSTISPRSPSGHKLFRTPSYKMPKTPSLSRQHPSTYVTQHTSSRSRSSSRVSSRAASPTREHIEALL